MRYFRWVDEGYHEWGDPLYWFEINDLGDAERQLEEYPNGNVTSYDNSHDEDEYGGLGVMVVDGDEDWRKSFEIAKTDFDARWLSHKPMNRDFHLNGK